MKQSEFLEIIEQNKGKHRQPIEVLVLGRKQEEKIIPLKETKLVVYYDIQDISSPTTISTNYDLSIKSFEINGKIIEEDLNTPIVYQFDTVGEHIIKYEFKEPTKIGRDSPLFYKLTTVKQVIIPDTFTEIGSNAFNSCTGLTSVTIPDSVTSIGGSAFAGCTGLTSITIPDSVTSIGNSVFNNCFNLTSITIGNGVTSIGLAFQGCSNLSTITSHIMNAPSVIGGTFANVKNGGTLYVPIGSSGYETWMNDQGNLGYYNWTKVEQ